MFDALITRAIALELNERIAGGRVQAVLSMDDLTLGLEIYAHRARSYLVASADPAANRIHLVSHRLRGSGNPPSPTVLLLKKYAENAFINRVVAVEQERILRIEFDHSQYGMSTFVAEMIGRLSNLILLDAAGAVLDAVRRVTPSMSRARTVKPRDVYLPPPPQEKLDPLTLASAELFRVLEAARGEPLWQVLVHSVRGTSPLLARELAFRASGRTDAESAPDLAKSLCAELGGIWRAPAEPTLASEAVEPIAVAAFALTHLAHTERMDSMSEALERFFGLVEPYQPTKEPLREILEAARARLERKRSALRREEVSASQVERLKLSGELILANAAKVNPGQKSLRAEMVEGEPLQIKLSPDLTPIENAQAYFAEYRRAKDAAAAVPARLEEVQADLEYADQVLQDLETAETRPEIEAVIAEARDAGLITEKHVRGVPKRTSKLHPALEEPRAYISPDGFQVLVGRNARQNELLTFRRASTQDVWLHARGVSGAHVVIVTKGRQVPDSTLEYSASLAAFYSKARGEKWADVLVAPRTNVRRVSGRAARPGLVTVRGERIVRVRPADPGRLEGDEVGE
jgi:predicted ribosome quality control (RQC) complex YloA/Tae2 family protein